MGHADQRLRLAPPCTGRTRARARRILRGGRGLCPGPGRHAAHAGRGGARARAAPLLPSVPARRLFAAGLGRAGRSFHAYALAERGYEESPRKTWARGCWRRSFRSWPTPSRVDLEARNAQGGLRPYTRPQSPPPTSTRCARPRWCCCTACCFCSDAKTGACCRS